MKTATSLPVFGGLLIAVLAAFAPPATTLGVALFIALVCGAAVLRDDKAVALLWGLSVVPLYLNVPGFDYPIPLALVVAAVLIWRTFVARHQAPNFGTTTDQVLVTILVGGAVISTLLSPNRLHASLNLLSLLAWLLVIPLARAVYKKPEDAAPSFRLLAIAVAAQAFLGFAQLAAGPRFTMGILTSPLASVFFNENALLPRLARQDFNWAMFDWAFPSGLFINSIVYGLCLAIGGLTLISVPPAWLPRHSVRVARTSGAIALVAGFASFKVSVWLALVAGVIVLLVTQRSQGHHRLWRTLLPVVLVVGAAGLTREIVTRRLTDVLAVSVLARLLIWSSYWGSLVHGGLIGTGPGQTEVIAPAVQTAAAGQRLQLFAAPENSWIGLAVEIGVPATAALLVLLIRLATRRRPPKAIPAAPGIIAALVGCTVGVHGLTDEHILPLLALIGGVASRLDSAETPFDRDAGSRVAGSLG